MNSIIPISPYDRVAFDDLKKAYCGIEDGDWILERKNKEPHNYWVLYQPQNDNHYNRYHVNPNCDKNNIFYFKNYIENPFIIKSSNHKLMDLVKRQFFDLQSKKESKVFEFSLRNGTAFVDSVKSRVFNYEKQWSLKVMQHVKPYFLSAYAEGQAANKAVRWIKGSCYIVERYNHGLAHGLRQGALAKDVFELLAYLKSNNPEIKALLNWVQQKTKTENHSDFIKKLEMASSFQRSGRQSEATSSNNNIFYKKYELQDAINFRIAAQKSELFANDLEIKVFEEAILWSNPGTLNENESDDLKYLRRILHAAHTFDLRRIPSFSEKRIKQDGLNQLFGRNARLSANDSYEKIVEVLWERSGDYLKATGDRDLVYKRKLQDEFFLQSKHPSRIVDAIYNVRSSSPNFSEINGVL